MPQKSWSAKRERQYVHIKENLLDRGKPHVHHRRNSVHHRSETVFKFVRNTQ